MFYVLQNESTAARRRVPILLTDSATGTTAQSGVASTNIYAYVNINGGAFIGGTGNVGEAGFGQYYYEFEANEVATLGLAGIHITAAGCRDYDAITQIAAFNLYSAGAGGGISAYDVWAFDYLSAGVVPVSAAERLEETRTEAYAANNNASQAYSNTINIPLQIWGDDLAGGPNSPYAAGTAGTILYDLSLGGGGITAGDVWSFTVLGFGTTNSAAQYLTAAYTDSANTYNQLVNFTPADVWSYTGVGGRTITGGIADTVTTLTDRSGFAITGGTITTVSDKTGYSLSASQSFNLTGNITGNVSGSVGSVTNPVSVATASMTGIAGSVWNSLTSAYSTTGTYGLNVLRADQANKVGDVTLYSSGGVNGVDADVHRIANDTTAATNLKNALTGIGATWTGNIAGTVNDVVNPVDVDTASMTGIAGTVWNYATRTLTSGGGSGISAADVWSYATRTITGGIADTVTTLTNKSGFAVTGGTVDTVTNGVTVTTNNDKTGYSLSGTQSFNLTGNITGNLSGSVGSVSGNVSGSVASVTNPVTFNSAQYAAIASSVWNAGTRTLTSGGSGISAYDVWNFVLSDANTAEVDLVTAASGAGISAADVWTYGSRTITGGIADTVTTLVDRSGFAITGGTITTVSDKIGYSLSASQTFNLTGNITGSLSGSVGSVSGAVGSVTSPVNVSTASMTGIAGTTWSYGTRTLTSGAGATAGDVWSYPTRSLTSGAGITVNAATNIINGPYFVKSNVDGQDGTLDVIRGMVQDIQLTVTDAFQNPFDTTALGLLVNFYDQAGTLTTSYATTELYGPAGLVQFTLDTAVTANEGRYNLILSAAGSGNTIKFGPLQTLVRPY